MSQHDQNKNSPARWWQWMLMYPSVGIAIVAAIPTIGDVVKSYQIDVSLTDVPIVSMNDKLFTKNATCFKQTSFTGIPTTQGLRVEALVCPTGDILIRVTRPGAREIYRWIDGKRLEEERSAFLTGLAGEAYAWESVASIALAQTGREVLCKMFLGNGRIKRIVREPNGRCFEEIVNTRTGQVVSRRAVQCSSRC